VYLAVALLLFGPQAALAEDDYNVADSLDLSVIEDMRTNWMPAPTSILMSSALAACGGRYWTEISKFRGLICCRVMKAFFVEVAANGSLLAQLVVLLSPA
jgi:hypothetical protein